MQQIQSSISSRNQTVIPADVRQALGIGAGDKILWRLVRIGKQMKAVTEPVPTNWTAFSLGLGEAIWKKVDIDAYIKQLRNEWNKKD